MSLSAMCTIRNTWRTTYSHTVNWKEMVLSYSDGKRWLKRDSDGAKVFKVVKESNVPKINFEAPFTSTARNDVVYAALR